MPLPWKKVNSTKISRLVNDQLHKSQKRRDGSSLVVETGFPTSLIDLFMKNREKWQKPTKKKRSKHVSIPSNDVSDSSVTARSTVSCPSPLLSPSSSGRFVNQPSLNCASPLSVDEIVAVESCDVVVDEKEHGVDRKGVLLAVLKMFLVVLLGLGMKKLTVGITLSAFLLFFLDCVGNRVSRWLKPCSESDRVLRFYRLVDEKVCNLLRFITMNVLDQKNSDFVMPDNNQDGSFSSLDSSESRCSILEIEVVETQCDLAARTEEIQPEIQTPDDFSSKRRFKNQGTMLKEVLMEKEEETCVVGELKGRKSRGDKFKLKMKKLVPKKLRKNKNRDHSESSEAVSEDNISQSEELQCKDEGMSEYDNQSRLSSVSSRKCNEEDPICALGGFLEVNEETAEKTTEESKDVEKGQIWRYLVLILIVLVGLIGGRAFALVLTLLWCLLLKSVQAMSPRYMKVPIIRSIND